LRGAKTSGEPWSRVSFAITFRPNWFWVSFNLLSNGWVNREAVSSGLSGRRTKLDTHIQLVLRLTTREEPHLYPFHTDSSRFTQNQQPLPFIFATNTIQFGLLQNSLSIKPHPHDWHIWQTLIYCRHFARRQNGALVQTLVTCTFPTDSRQRWFTYQDQTCASTNDCQINQPWNSITVINSFPVQHKIIGASVKHTSRGMAP
jgi:hypothetical protein